MKFLFDLIPIILFFITFKFTNIYSATIVAMLATILQIIWVAIRYKKIETIQWISLILIIVFGGMTIAFQDKRFIQIKPTILYWIFAVGLIVSSKFLKRNLIEVALTKQVTLKNRQDTKVWKVLNNYWVTFFFLMGGLNLYVAFNYEEDTWVNFKMFGSMGLLIIFIVAQGIWLTKHIEQESIQKN